MKKLARITTHHTIRGSQPKAETFLRLAGHSAYLLKTFDRWLIGFRKSAPMGLDSIKGGARPIGREIQNKY